ncbi:hypothetical protein LF887_22915 [Chryseobacterium sp. MEBOG06]|uniref:hypothetical protein n=1 Tax=Chryseobacterium sp. MEBOG06 TaxID=2879938 RepID=UPI001F30A744|nr:hypothetical protein [Chryseobacterium sp. MEBOG06]UKB83823.1 hypothetical protein LF887_22915 [Chryseobacterium sp. MEBOG06]
MKNFKKLSREGRKGIIAGVNFPANCIEGGGPEEGGCSVGNICSGGKCVPYDGNPGGGGGNPGGGDVYTCICPWGTFTQSTPCPEFYCITG